MDGATEAGKGIVGRILQNKEIDTLNMCVEENNRAVIYSIVRCFDACDPEVKLAIINNFTELSKDIPREFKEVVKKALNFSIKT